MGLEVSHDRVNTRLTQKSRSNRLVHLTSHTLTRCGAIRPEAQRQCNRRRRSKSKTAGSVPPLSSVITNVPHAWCSIVRGSTHPDPATARCLASACRSSAHVTMSTSGSTPFVNTRTQMKTCCRCQAHEGPNIRGLCSID